MGRIVSGMNAALADWFDLESYSRDVSSFLPSGHSRLLRMIHLDPHQTDPAWLRFHLVKTFSIPKFPRQILRKRTTWPHVTKSLSLMIQAFPVSRRFLRGQDRRGNDRDRRDGGVSFVCRANRVVAATISVPRRFSPSRFPRGAGFHRPFFTSECWGAMQARNEHDRS